MAIIFSDNFTRANSNTVGNGWSENELAAGNCSISSNSYRSNNPSNGAIQSIYRNLGVNNAVVITGSFIYVPNVATDRTTQQYIDVLSSSGASGMGLIAEIRTNNSYGSTGFANIILHDTSTTLATVAKNSLMNVSGNIAYELIIYADNSMEGRVWDASGGKPGSPDVTSAARTPTAAGANVMIGSAPTSSPNSITSWYNYSVSNTDTSTIKTYFGTATANVKTVLNGTAIANRKTWNGIA